jgi:acetyl esterase/lipase
MRLYFSIYPKLYKTFYLIVFFIVSAFVSGQEYTVPLFKGKIPNSKHSRKKERLVKGDFTWLYDVEKPIISVYLPQKKYTTGRAVVICPGGGYRFLSYDNFVEGTDVARYFNSIGVAGIVLNYRLPSLETSKIPYLSPIIDVKRAMRMVRANAVSWNINPSKIGIMGFSAGGHLASTLATHFDNGDLNSKDIVERFSCRPDFMILLYPVITFLDSTIATRTQKTLLGNNPDKVQLQYFSNEQHVTKNTPPTYISHAENDSIVSVRHSILFYQALRRNNVSAELHILPVGGHGYGLVPTSKHLSSWKENLELWLQKL